MDIPQVESIDVYRKIWLVETSDQNFILIFTNMTTGTIVLFNKFEERATWSSVLSDELTFFSILKNGYCVLGRKDSKPLLFLYENDRLTPIEWNLPLDDSITQLEELPDGNLIGLSPREGEIFLFDSNLEKQKTTQIPEFDRYKDFMFFISPCEKVYVMNYGHFDHDLRLNGFDIHNLELYQTLKYDLGKKKQHFSDNFRHTWFNKRHLTDCFLLANRYIVFIEGSIFNMTPLFSNRLWQVFNKPSSNSNYWLSLFDLSNEKLLIESELIASIPSDKLRTGQEPLGKPDYLYASALPDGRLVLHADKSSIIDQDLRNQYQQFMIFDILLNLQDDVSKLKELEKITIPPLATMIGDYAGFFTVKQREFKDIPVEYKFKNSCKIL